jgi:hypothetical protein
MPTIARLATTFTAGLLAIGLASAPATALRLVPQRPNRSPQRPPEMPMSIGRLPR